MFCIRNGSAAGKVIIAIFAFGVFITGIQKLYSLEFVVCCNSNTINKV